MNSQLFYFLNIVIGLAFLAWFLTSRGDKPTKLKMKPGEAPPRFQDPVPAPREERAVKAAPPPPPPADVFEEKAKVAAKNLNIFFLYNGHDWDAYEVLGLPAGASLPMVTDRYQKLIKTADQGKLEFFEAAYQAILKKS